VRRSSARQAAAAGLDFVAVVVAIGVIERWKHLDTPGDIAVHASHNVFATVTLLYGLAGVFLFFFVSTLAARMRELEGGSGRLASAVNGSGAFIAGILALGVGMMWAAHQLRSPESAAIATSLLDGPTLFFPAAVLVGASGIVGVRARGLPVFSRLASRLSLPLAVAFVAASGLILFKNYAWINDTGNIALAAWVLVLSVIGIARWGELDGAPVVVAAPVAEEAAEVRPARRAPREPAPEPAPAAPPAEPSKRRPARKFAPRHTDLAREYQRRLHEEDEADQPDEAPPTEEEFEYGGPPRMTEPVDVTPARRRPRRAKPQPRKPAPRKTAPRGSATSEASEPTKPSPRKPRPRRKPAPPADTTEVITPDES
jgi:hypothetical protein